MHDEKCRELADHFLDGEHLPQSAHVELADHIQVAVEDWIAGAGVAFVLPAKLTAQPSAAMIEMMRHALGHGGRNFYCATDGQDGECWRWLVSEGFASHGRTINEGRDTIFQVTPAGEKYLAELTAKPETPSKCACGHPSDVHAGSGCVTCSCAGWQAPWELG